MFTSVSFAVYVLANNTGTSITIATKDFNAFSTAQENTGTKYVCPYLMTFAILGVRCPTSIKSSLLNMR